MRVYQNKQINTVESLILLKAPQQIISQCHKERHRYFNGYFLEFEVKLRCTQRSWSDSQGWQGLSGSFKHMVLKSNMFETQMHRPNLLELQSCVKF